MPLCIRQYTSSKYTFLVETLEVHGGPQTIHFHMIEFFREDGGPTTFWPIVVEENTTFGCSRILSRTYLMADFKLQFFKTNASYN